MARSKSGTTQKRNQIRHRHKRREKRAKALAAEARKKGSSSK